MSEQDTLGKVDLASTKPASPRQSAWRWQWLVAPLMGVSFILHIALLFLPIPSVDLIPEEEVEEEATGSEEEEVIDVLNLADITAPEPPPEEAPPPEEQAPPPAENVAPNLDPTQIVETPEEAPPPVEEQPAESFVDTSRDQFISGISDLGVEDYTSDLGLPRPNFFRRPENAGCFIDAGGNPVPGIRVLNWLDKEPQTLLRENLQNVYGQSGVAFVEQAAYCGERYFYLYAPSGEFFMAMSLVQMEGSALLVSWEARPQ
ncbi:MAG: hypothetical protein AAGF24_07200 [Cyanobacteria bacterium P01_H01_bin.121]